MEKLFHEKTLHMSNHHLCIDAETNTISQTAEVETTT